MGRYLVWALGVAAWSVLSAAPAAAQVDIGVWTPYGGGRVVVGAPPVYYPPPVYAYPPPVYAVPGAHFYGYYGPYPLRPAWGYGGLHNHVRFARPYHGYSPYYRYPRYGGAYRTYGYTGPAFRGDYYSRGVYSRGPGRYRRR